MTGASHTAVLPAPSQQSPSAVESQPLQRTTQPADASDPHVQGTQKPDITGNLQAILMTIAAFEAPSLFIALERNLKQLL